MSDAARTSWTSGGPRQNRRQRTREHRTSPPRRWPSAANLDQKKGSHLGSRSALVCETTPLGSALDNAAEPKSLYDAARRSGAERCWAAWYRTRREIRTGQLRQRTTQRAGLWGESGDRTLTEFPQKRIQKRETVLPHLRPLDNVAIRDAVAISVFDVSTS